MFNVDEKDYIKHQDRYQDDLYEVSSIYNDYEDNTEEIFLALNQHLKHFPLLNSWRIEICYIWDICRMSMICAVSVYEEHYKNKLSQDDITDEYVHYSRTIEYYIENVIYRSFSILEKLAHGINHIINLGLPERAVSFAKIRQLLLEQKPNDLITGIIKKFEEDNDIYMSIREIRNAITHRKDPLAPVYSYDDIEVEIENAVPEGPNKIKANILIQEESTITVDTLVESTIKYYPVFTELIDRTLRALLQTLDERFIEEQKYYQNLEIE